MFIQILFSRAFGAHFHKLQGYAFSKVNKYKDNMDYSHLLTFYNDKTFGINTSSAWKIHKHVYLLFSDVLIILILFYFNFFLQIMMFMLVILHIKVWKQYEHGFKKNATPRRPITSWMFLSIALKNKPFKHFQALHFLY